MWLCAPVYLGAPVWQGVPVFLIAPVYLGAPVCLGVTVCLSVSMFSRPPVQNFQDLEMKKGTSSGFRQLKHGIPAMLTFCVTPLAASELADLTGLHV